MLKATIKIMAASITASALLAGTASAQTTLRIQTHQGQSSSYAFPGLKEGDHWCLCAVRWLQAHEAGYAPKMYLRRTNIKTLEIIPLETLKAFALDLN